MSFRSLFVFGLLALLGPVVLSRAGEPVGVLKRLFIASTVEKSAALPVDSGNGATVYVADVSALQAPDFPRVAEPFIGKPITEESANALAVAIDRYLRGHDRILIKYADRNYDPVTGILRMTIVVAQYKDIQVRGGRYTAPQRIKEKMGIKPGDEVRASILEDAVNWANTNPFRQVKVLINDLADQPGKADLIIGVEDRLPLRFTASYDDTGSPIIGKNHYSGSLQYGNLWGRDHQISYQYLTTDYSKLFQSHSLDYRAPLPWRHTLQLTAGYLRVRPTFTVLGLGDIEQNGKNINATARYTIPIRTGENAIEYTTGVDFKEGNNTLAYGGTVLDRFTTTTDTFQWTNSFSMVKRDKRGAWVFAAGLNASPGSVNSRNTDEALSKGRTNTKSQYLVGTLTVQRLLNLSHEWSLFSRFFIQRTSSNVPGSEQLSIGGSSSVRGFDERIYTGDEGFIFGNDLQSPVVRYTLPFAKKRPPLETRFVAFYDIAKVFYRVRDRNDAVLPRMASAGLGVRVTLPANFMFSADYGWQLTEITYNTSEHARGHVKVVLAF